MNTSPASTEIQIDRLIRGQEALQNKVDETKREFEADLKRVTEKAEADAKDNAAKITALEDERTKALKWGVMTLGTAVMGMIYWIFDHLPTGGVR